MRKVLAERKETSWNKNIVRENKQATAKTSQKIVNVRDPSFILFYLQMLSLSESELCNETLFSFIKSTRKLWGVKWSFYITEVDIKFKFNQMGR